MPAHWPDWVFWTSGGVLAVAGGLLLLWALFSDRSRGQQRCPKCWYEMEGVPRDEVGWVCPECGKAILKEKGLHKTRRRKRWAGGSFAVAIIGTSLVVYPTIRHGWSGMPTWMLIHALGWSTDQSLLSAMDQRLSTPGRNRSATRWNEALLSESEWNMLRDRLVGMLGHPDERTFQWASKALIHRVPGPALVFERLERKLSHGNLRERIDVAYLLMSLGRGYQVNPTSPNAKRFHAERQRFEPGLVRLMMLSLDDPLLTPFPTSQSLGRLDRGSPRETVRINAIISIICVASPTKATMAALEDATSDSDTEFARLALIAYQILSERAIP